MNSILTYRLLSIYTPNAYDSRQNKLPPHPSQHALSNELPAVRSSLILTRFGFCGLIPVVSRVQRIRIHIPRCRRGDVVSITYKLLRHESHDAELGAEKVDGPHGFVLTRMRGLWFGLYLHVGILCFLVAELYGYS